MNDYMQSGVAGVRRLLLSRQKWADKLKWGSMTAGSVIAGCVTAGFVDS